MKNRKTKYFGQYGYAEPKRTLSNTLARETTSIFLSKNTEKLHNYEVGNGQRAELDNELGASGKKWQSSTALENHLQDAES